MKNKILLSLICVLVGLVSIGCAKKNVVSIDNLRSLRNEGIEYTDTSSEMDYYVERSELTNDIEYNEHHLDYYVGKSEQYNDIKYNEYYEGETRKIFLASNITDIIITRGGQNISLNKFLLSDTKMSDYDIIHFMMRKLDKKNTLKDGGTTIYRGKNKDITMIVCNTLDKNYDVYIGDYNMKYEQFMCN